MYFPLLNSFVKTGIRLHSDLIYGNYSCHLMVGGFNLQTNPKTILDHQQRFIEQSRLETNWRKGKFCEVKFNQILKEVRGVELVKGKVYFSGDDRTTKGPVVFELDPQNGSVSCLVTETTPVKEIAFLGEDRLILSVHEKKVNCSEILVVWDITRKCRVSSLTSPGHENLSILSMRVNENQLASSGFDVGIMATYLATWDLNAQVESRLKSEFVHDFEFLDTNTLLTCCGKHEILMWDLRIREVVRKTADVGAFSILPHYSNNYIVADSFGYYPYVLLDLRTWTELPTLPDAPFLEAEFSDSAIDYAHKSCLEGDKLISCDDLGNVHCWNMATKQYSNSFAVPRVGNVLSASDILIVYDDDFMDVMSFRQ